MSANQATMVASIKAADTAKVAAVVTATVNYQGAIATNGVLAGYRPGFPTNFATYDAGRIAADKQHAADLAAAETARQGAVFTAKDLLRSQGEIPF